MHTFMVSRSGEEKRKREIDYGDKINKNVVVISLIIFAGNYKLLVTSSTQSFIRNRSLYFFITYLRQLESNIIKRTFIHVCSIFYVFVKFKID